MRNINRINNEKLHYNCLQQLPTLRLKTKDLRKLWDSGERKWKAGIRALHPVFSLKIWCHSYLVDNSQKATLNFYFKSRFSMKPSAVNSKYILQKIVCESNFFVYNSM